MNKFWYVVFNIQLVNQLPFSAFVFKTNKKQFPLIDVENALIAYLVKRGVIEISETFTSQIVNQVEISEQDYAAYADRHKLQ